MKSFTSITSILALSISAVFLSGCGGGSSSSTPAQSTSSTPVVGTKTVRTGTVAAKYVAGNAPRYIALQITGQSLGSLVTVNVESASGAITNLNTLSLSGDITDIQDIAGTANWAMGRWFRGTIDATATTAATTLSFDNSSLHYFVGNSLSVLPLSGNYACTGFNGTYPSLISWPSNTSTPESFGRASGTATLSFSGLGGNLSTDLTVKIGSVSGNALFQGTIAATNSTIVKGGFYGSGSGAALTLFDAGGGKVQAVQGYKIVVSNGATYQGIATWTCSPG